MKKIAVVPAAIIANDLMSFQKKMFHKAKSEDPLVSSLVSSAFVLFSNFMFPL